MAERMRKQRGAEVFRITGARQSLADDVRGRQRRYVIAMLVRTLSVIAAAALWNVERYVAVVALVLGVLLPYVAVVIASMRPGERAGAARRVRTLGPQGAALGVLRAAPGGRAGVRGGTERGHSPLRLSATRVWTPAGTGSDQGRYRLS